MENTIYICDVCRKEKRQEEIKRIAILITTIPYNKFMTKDICKICQEIEDNHETNRWNK